MSGIAGIVSGREDLRESPIPGRMLALLSARGPDRTGAWTSAAAVLCHTLLATTVEAEREVQPCSLDGEVFIAADCRIDGREDLWASLDARGRKDVRTCNDAELILHAYAVWGEACVDHLIGDFAFAIWDARRHQLFCARDQSGVKPFYYAELPGGLAISNTLRCLLLHPSVSTEIDELTMLDFLMTGFNLETGTTIYQGIRALPAAHVLTWRIGELHVRRYWERPIDEPVRFRRDRDYVDRFVELLDLSIRDRVRTSHLVVQMSGGLDSTLLAARAVKLGCNVEAHSAYYDRLFPDREREYAQAAASHLGIPIHYYCGDAYTPYQGYEELAAQMPEPDNAPNGLFAMDMRRGMAAASRVSFYGEGPDNLLPYEWKAYLRYLQAQGEYGRLAGAVWKSFLLDPRIPLAFSLRRSAKHVPFSSPAFPEWIQPDLMKRYQLRQRWADYWSFSLSRHGYHPRGYASMSVPNWNYNFLQADPGVNGVNAETRHPYLDLRLARYLLSLPVIPWCRRKLVVRMASRAVLPETIWNRPKTGLVGDPLQVHYNAGRLNGLVTPPTDVFSRYIVRWPEIDSGSSWGLYLSTMPIALNYWWQNRQKP